MCSVPEPGTSTASVAPQSFGTQRILLFCQWISILEWQEYTWSLGSRTASVASCLELIGDLCLKVCGCPDWGCINVQSHAGLVWSSACQCSCSLLLLLFTSKFRTETTTTSLKSFIILFISILINELEHDSKRIYKFRPSRLIFFFPVRCTLFQFPSTLLCSHSWSLWVVCGISQKFSHSAEPLEPQALTKWAGGLPKLDLVGRLPVFPGSNWAGKEQNSFFHSISFSFWCWLHPKRQRQWKGREEGISYIFSVLSKGSVGPQGGIQNGNVGGGWYLHTSVSCGNWGKSYSEPARKTRWFPIFHGKPT